MGLSPDSTLTQAEVDARVNECTGILLASAQRSEAQRRNLANILNVVRVPEAFFRSLMSSLVTFNMQLLTQGFLGGRNPFTNVSVYYTGSDDDEALNAGVERYASDPEAVAALSADGDPTGKVFIPVVTVHAIGDGRVFVENESAYREVFERAGTLDNLFQSFVNRTGHPAINTNEGRAGFRVLQQWVETGTKPTQEALVAACEGYREISGGECQINPTYQPYPWESRVYPREP